LSVAVTFAAEAPDIFDVPGLLLRGETGFHFVPLSGVLIFVQLHNKMQKTQKDVQ